MPVYMVHGFRWPRAGFTGIRVYVVLHNLEDAAAEYLQQPLTSQLMLDSLKQTNADVMSKLPDLQFIEQYDPDDTTSVEAVSKPYAFVAAKVMTLGEPGEPGANLSWNTEELDREGAGLSESGQEALAQLRDRLAPGEKIGWWLVYNGDPAREYPHSDEEEYEEIEEKPTMRLPAALTKLFGRRNDN
ncbi:hypothetical protein PHISCL_05586 [Aspergillus sclerotialis]|uniref:Developmental regulator FlbE n=1 Tax=Aspergillus sclerotialis TaxID=2070753 RepID=A0A3A2ZHU1_9EURO|nr:hypothetical protein PHISCL_05586 [Aspergillus sclerotialis]